MSSTTEPAILAAIATVGARAREYGADLARWKADPDFANIAVRASADARLLILSYTDKAQYAGIWTPLERACRGLIVESDTGRVVARPFPKFHNWGELPADEQARLAAVGIADVTAKEDGSLGILFRYDGEWRAATRGAFDSPQARWAERAIRQIAAGDSLLLNVYTYLVELIHPQNRVVIDYRGRCELVLLGVVGREYGVDLPREEVERVARWAGMPVVQTLDLREHDVAVNEGTLLNACAKTTDCEGWVARFNDGTRVKFKTRWYFDLHRLVSGFNAERVREAILAGKDADYRAGIPEEFWPEFDRYSAAILARIAERVAAVEYWHSRLVHLDTGGREARATFARAVIEQVPEPLRGNLFGFHDGKDQWQKIVRGLDLSDLMPNTGGGFSSWTGEEG